MLLFTASSRYAPSYSLMAVSIMLAALLLISGCSNNPSKTKKRDAIPEKTEQGYYEAAQRALKNQHYEAASRHLKSLDTFYPTSTLNERAQLELMYAYFKQGDYANASTTVQSFMTNYPSHPQTDYAMYLLGVAKMNLAQNALMDLFKQLPSDRDLNYHIFAFNTFSTLLEKYPQTAYADDVRQRMLYIRNLQAAHELTVAKFYQTRQSYVASINRALSIVQFFPSSPSVPEALAILQQNYEKIGNSAQAQAYANLLARNPAAAKSERTNETTVSSNLTAPVVSDSADKVTH